MRTARSWSYNEQCFVFATLPSIWFGDQLLLVVTCAAVDPSAIRLCALLWEKPQLVYLTAALAFLFMSHI